MGLFNLIFNLMAQNVLIVTQTTTQQLKEGPPIQHLKVQVCFPLQVELKEIYYMKESHNKMIKYCIAAGGRAGLFNT